DVTWKNYLDSLSCTQCGRCTSVCPASITGKKLSPRKIMMDLRARMDEKGPGLVAGLTAGNVLTAANAGTEVRFGYRLPQDFGSDVIRPGSGVSVPEPSGPQTEPWGRFGLHIFAAAQIQAVAHNIFLDGNTWKDSHSVEKHPIVADISLGLAFTYERLKVTYRHLLRTKEFTRQDEPQVIGSLTLTLAF
ncbi:MAG: lipid A-modifier LpxR family protein, partial [Thermodesulfobacteriota bacterium]